MICCEKCFVDTEIVDIIRAKKKRGSCNFCDSKNVYIYDLRKDRTISDMLGEIIDIYSEVSLLPTDFPKENVDLIKNSFNKDWSIFTGTPEMIYKLIVEICYDKYIEQPELFDNPVGIAESQNKQFLNDYSILGDKSWNNFLESIKFRNRFHTSHINKEILNLFLRCVKRTCKSGSIFYRARVCSDNKGLDKKQMGAPPMLLATSGRVNPTGISVLYLADTIRTTLHEIRAGVYDYVVVGTFQLKRNIEIIDFANLDKISPFIANNTLGIPYIQQAINNEHLKLISHEIAKPLRRNDASLDYIPTQYISDYIKSEGYDGVKYISTMYSEGYNLAVFDEKVFKCTKTTIYDIKSLSYDYDIVNLNR